MTTTELLSRPDVLVRPVDDDATRRQFLGLLAAAGLLTACGSDDSATPGAGAAPQTRSVDHTSGTTQVPVDPQRVVALELTVTVALIALGLAPVAAPAGTAPLLADVAELVPSRVEVPETATTADGEPAVEAIAALQPDLMIGTEFQADPYEQLSAIAATVLVSFGKNGGWRERFLSVANAVNRGERAAEVEAAYLLQIERLPAQVRDTVVAFVRPDTDGQFRIDGGVAAFAGSVADDADLHVLTAPGGVGEFEEGSGFVTVSGERLDVLSEAGLIVVPDFRSLGDEQDGITQFEANPLWAGLPAVQAGRVVQLPGLVYNGGSHYAAELLLRGVADALS